MIEDLKKPNGLERDFLCQEYKCDAESSKVNASISKNHLGTQIHLDKDSGERND